MQLNGVGAYDPYGDRTEHDSAAGNATDGNPGTYWNTEHYDGGLPKPGVGLVVGTSGAKQLKELVIRSDTPGFTAVVKASSSPSGGFAPVSTPQDVGGNTTFTLKDGPARQYYLVWITDLGSNSSVQINEVTASS